MSEKYRVRNAPAEAITTARQMRRQLTSAEAVLWNAIRNRQLHGWKFRRQHAVGPYILDFCCPDQRLVIEVDGDIHEYQREYDNYRTEHLEQFGYRVLRFRNEDVLSDLDGVLNRIEETLVTSEWGAGTGIGKPSSPNPFSQFWEKGDGTRNSKMECSVNCVTPLSQFWERGRG